MAKGDCWSRRLSLGARCCARCRRGHFGVQRLFCRPHCARPPRGPRHRWLPPSTSAQEWPPSRAVDLLQTASVDPDPEGRDPLRNPSRKDLGEESRRAVDLPENPGEVLVDTFRESREDLLVLLSLRRWALRIRTAALRHRAAPREKGLRCAEPLSRSCREATARGCAPGSNGGREPIPPPATALSPSPEELFGSRGDRRPEGGSFRRPDPGPASWDARVTLLS